jgi:hypothetical protein
MLPSEDRRAISEKMKADMQSSKLKLYEDIAAKSAKAPVQVTNCAKRSQIMKGTPRLKNCDQA